MPTDKEMNKMLIYAVDDDPINLKLLKSILIQNNFERVELIYSGADLLKEINMEIPDLILLDIMMPGMSGYDTLKEIKGSHKLKHIPVIMITAAPLEEGMEPLSKSFDLGAMDYISKPFNTVELIKRVKSALFLEKQRKDLEEALKTIRILEKLLPICSYCKKIRNEDSYWSDVEIYISEHTDTMFSHSICPDCYKIHIMPQLDSIKKEDK
jgi:CheY-like chemotaxis protein